MTRDEITSLVTSTVGQTDSASVTLCNTFVQRAYEMTWNAELWRDTVTLDTSATVVQGTNTFNLPTGFDRIVSIQLAYAGLPSGFLDPTTSTFIIQSEPTALTVQGRPTKYEEFVHTDGTKKVRIFPVPDAAYGFTISGKRTCPTLAGGDSLQIRNVDNAVIALATADMYTRQRQLGKASELAKKAGAFLDEARKIEQEQSNQPRIVKQLTVAGNSLEEMVGAVSERTDQWSPKAVISIKEFLRRNYQDVYDRHLWTESTILMDSVSVLGVLVLPPNVDRVIAIRGTSTLGQLSAVQPSLYYGINPQIFEQTGDPLAFSYLTPVAVPVLPTVIERIKLVSTSANDKSPVFVRGDLGVDASSLVFSDVSESINLNGTTPVVTTNSFLIPTTIAKGITAGAITISGNTSLVQFGNLNADERERKHIRIQFRPTPTANVTCRVLCKRRIIPLVQDEDTPLLRDIGNVLINLATADMFSKLGNKDGAVEARAKGEDAIKTLIDLETNQGALNPQVIPEVDYYPREWADADSWIVAKV